MDYMTLVESDHGASSRKCLTTHHLLAVDSIFSFLVIRQNISIDISRWHLYTRYAVDEGASGDET